MAAFFVNKRNECLQHKNKHLFEENRQISETLRKYVRQISRRIIARGNIVKQCQKMFEEVIETQEKLSFVFYFESPKKNRSRNKSQEVRVCTR